MSAPRDPATLMMLVADRRMAVADQRRGRLPRHLRHRTRLARPGPARGPRRAPDLRPLQPRHRDLSSGQYCRLNACVPLPPEVLCGEGDGCRDCECEDGLGLSQPALRLAGQASTARPLVCEDERGARRRGRSTLALKCSTRKKTVADIVSRRRAVRPPSGSSSRSRTRSSTCCCRPSRTASPSTSRAASRTSSARTGRAPEVLEHYLDQVRRFAGPLREAKQIFVIGRASPDGDAEANHWLALARDQVRREPARPRPLRGHPRDRARQAARAGSVRSGLPTTRTIEPRAIVRPT